MSNHFIKMRNVKFPTCTSFHKNFDPLTCFIPHSFLLQNIESSLKSANGLLQNRQKRLKCIENRECDTFQMRKKEMRTKRKDLAHTHVSKWEKNKWGVGQKRNDLAHTHNFEKKSKWGATWANKELDKKETTWHTHVSEAVGLRTRDWGIVTGYWFFKDVWMQFWRAKIFWK